MAVRFPPFSLVGAGAALLVLASCGASHHDTDLDRADAGLLDAAPTTPDVDAPQSDAGESDAADPTVPPDASIAQGVLQLGAEGCSQRLPGIAVRSARRVLVTTGCGFYAVDTLANKVEQLEVRGEAIDEQGETVAVLAGKLGLSRDGGETFEWTDWQLARCQGTPRVHAGAGFAVVSCVAGVGRWRGAGSDFELLAPSGSVPISPGVAVGGAHVVLQDYSGWFYSADAGDHFQPLAIDGLPENNQPLAMVLDGSTLWIPGASAAGDPNALFAATVGSGTFTRVGGLPVAGTVYLRYSHGVLIADGVSTHLSADQGQTFRAPPLQAVEGYGLAAGYLDGHLYRVANNKLYVDAVQP